MASRWKRLSYEKTVSTGGLRLFRNLIEGGFISWSVLAPCTDREVAEQIALNSKPAIPVDLLSAELSKKPLLSGVTMFGSPWKMKVVVFLRERKQGAGHTGREIG